MPEHTSWRDCRPYHLSFFRSPNGARDALPESLGSKEGIWDECQDALIWRRPNYPLRPIVPAKILEYQDRGENAWHLQMPEASVIDRPVSTAAILVSFCQLRLAFKTETRECIFEYGLVARSVSRGRLFHPRRKSPFENGRTGRGVERLRCIADCESRRNEAAIDCSSRRISTTISEIKQSHDRTLAKT